MKNFFKSLFKKNTINKIYLHIGFHKTGSSFIQQALYKNKDLLAQNDVSLICLSHYKRDMDKGNASYLLKRLSRLKKKLNESKSTAIISSESMSWWSVEKITKLKKALNVYCQDITVIAYLRNHDEYAVSMKQQGAKADNIAKIFGHSESLLPDLTDEVKYQVRYFNNLKKWADIFGCDNVSIASFDYLKKNNISLLDNFLAKTQLSDLGVEPIEKVNESIDYYWQMFLHKHQDLLWANKAVRNALLPELITMGHSPDKKKITVAEAAAFRAVFKQDIEDLKFLDNSQILFNEYLPEPREFVFNQNKAQQVQEDFIGLQAKYSKALYEQGQIRDQELQDVILAIAKLSKPQALALCLEALSDQQQIRKIKNLLETG